MKRCESDSHKESEPKSGINILVFDLDGTLIDTMGKHALVFADYMNAYYGIEPAKSAKHYIDTAGKPTSEQISTLLGKQTEEKSIILGQLIDKDLEQIEPTPFENTEDTLKMLKLKGYRISVSSSHQTEAVGRILGKTGLLKFVDHYLGTDPNDSEFKKGVPHFKELAKRYGITFEELTRQSVFIGDGDSDMNAAKSCKVPGVGKIGTRDKKSLEKSGAWTTFSDFEELPKKLDNISDLLRRPVKDVHQEKILVIGNFSKSDVITNFSTEVNEAGIINDRIEILWQEKLDKGFFNGKLVSLNAFKVLGEKLILNFGRTDFKQYVGTRNFESLREYGIDSIANPTSTNSAVITSDGKLIIGQKKTGDGLGSFDGPGGYIDPQKDLDENGKIDIFNAAKREVIEELGVKDEELDEGLCLGLSYEYAGLCHPVLSFIFKSSLTSEAILERKGEELDIFAFDLERDENSEETYFMDILKKNYQNVEPDGRTTIALARQYLRGRDLEKRIIRTKNQI